MKPFIIAGPCAIEPHDVMEDIATEINRLKYIYGIEIIFKASFDKANRTSVNSYRGIGLEDGLTVLRYIKDKYNLLVTTDVHETHQIEKVAKFASIIQIPALLSRQTDLIKTAADTGLEVNIKKGQFMSYKDVLYAIKKARLDKVYVTERGNCFGYNDIIVDFRNIYYMKRHGIRVIMDCSHSVQTPNSKGGSSGGNKRLIIPMARAAKAFGVNGYFVEVHPHPSEAKSDPDSSLPLEDLELFIQNILE